MATVTFDTHAAVRELRAGGFDEDQAEKLVDVFRRAAGTPVTRFDIGALATKTDLERLATKRELAALEARLAWRLIGAGMAIAGFQAAAMVGLFRLVLAP